MPSERQEQRWWIVVNRKGEPIEQVESSFCDEIEVVPASVADELREQLRIVREDWKVAANWKATADELRSDLNKARVRVEQLDAEVKGLREALVEISDETWGGNADHAVTSINVIAHKALDRSSPGQEGE